MTARIMLVRHGRSAHPPASRWMRGGDVRSYEQSYNVAGILPDDPPPSHLVEETSRADVVVASDLPRAIESARRLAPGRDPAILPLLREIDLEPPGWIPIALPIAVWDAISHAQWSYRLARRVAHEAVTRGTRVAEWLADRAGDRATLVAVTHGGFRRIVADRLVARAWRADGRRDGYANWSVWSFSRRDRRG